MSQQQNTSALVSNQKNKQAEEALSNKYGAEEGVWTKSMLSTLERGVKGNKWFSLIDKVYAERTLELAWEKVRSNAGACGVAHITEHQTLDGWVRMRLRSILRKRDKRKGRGRGKDHQRYKNCYIIALGFPCLMEAKLEEQLNHLKPKSKVQAGANY